MNRANGVRMPNMPERAPSSTRNTPSRKLEAFLLKHPNGLMVHRPWTLERFILIAPEWMRVEILANVFRLPGGVIRVHWNRGYCSKSRPREARLFRADELMSDTIAPFPSSLDPIGRTAKEAFYKGNTFCLARTRLALQTCFEPTSFWLSRADTRCWIRHLEVVVRIAPLRTSTYFPYANCRCPLESRYACKHSDWPFLGRLASGVYGFTALETLSLVFKGAEMTAAELEAFDNDLNTRNPFVFPAWELRVSAWSISAVEGGKQSQPDESVTATLLQHMSATGPPGDPPKDNSADEQIVSRPDSSGLDGPGTDPDSKSVPQKVGRRKRFMLKITRFRTQRTLPDKDSGTSGSSS